MEVSNCTLDTYLAQHPTSTYDMVTMLDVLEHVLDPAQTIAELHELLGDGGYLSLTLPNIGSTDFKLFGKHREWLTPPAHLQYFAPNTLRQFLEGHGFEVVHLESRAGDSSGGLLFQAFFSLQQWVFYSFQYVLGRERLLRWRSSLRADMRVSSNKQQQEYT